MNANESASRRDRNGLPLAILAGFFALLAFAQSPVGWGWFDWVAVSIFTAAAIWNLCRFAKCLSRRSHA
jgi:hypothetical protein